MNARTVKYAYSIRTANGVMIKNLQVIGNTQAETDKKINQMYRHCEILSCEQMVFYKTANPNYEDVLDSIIRSEH
jgi:hypothetical protein